MRITILTYGSRGDVQPFVPLSLGLLARGHSVKLLAPVRFKTLVEGNGIHFVPLAGDPAALSRHLNDSGTNFLKAVHNLMTHAVAIGADVLRQTEIACSDADLVVHTFMHAVGAHTLAREKNIPDVHIQLFPMFTPTGDYPNITLPNLRIRSLNKLTHMLSHRIAFWASRLGYEQIRRKVRLPKRKLYSPFDKNPVRPSTPILCAWSPIVLPPSRDWNPDVHVTGYLFGDDHSSYQPSTILEDFLAYGEAPVCVSFGSMLNQDAARIDHIVREALRQTSHRGIILSGWRDIKDEISHEILCLEEVPHHWLLPRCKMIIHHGGAGTTSAGLRAGIPNIVIPHTADQPFWGSRVHSMGAGPQPLHVKELSVNGLSRAILEADHHDVYHDAYEIGQALRSEDGVAQSIEWIEKYSKEFHRKQR